MSDPTPPSPSPRDRYPVERSGTATMRPRARLISLIGEDLISDEPVAVVELVKNAYDADADRVTIRFEGADPDAPERVVVEDDGDGMTLTTVLGAWFEPGTVAKRGRKSSDRGRVYQGAKGIGRFAAARLAGLLFMETVARGEAEGTVALVDWGVFDEDSYLDTVTVDYEVRPIGDLGHGTRLTLETLRKTWDEEAYESLHSRLSRLISPFDDVSDFEIEMDVPAHPELSGPVEPPGVVLKPIYSLEGRVSKRGRFTGSFRHGGEVVREFKKVQLGGEGKRPLSGPFQVEIRAWDRDRESLEPIARRYDLTITEVRRVLNNYSGVSIYRDGFRVYPYGQKGNDWLGLDNRSRQNPSMHLANNQVIAAVRISREANPELRDRSTREGMVLNDEHKALETWFKEVLTLLERERYEIRPRQDADTIVDPIFEVFDIGGTFDFAQEELGRDHPVTKEISETQKRLREGVDRVQNVYSRLLHVGRAGAHGRHRHPRDRRPAGKDQPQADPDREASSDQATEGGPGSRVHAVPGSPDVAGADPRSPRTARPPDPRQAREGDLVPGRGRSGRHLRPVPGAAGEAGHRDYGERRGRSHPCPNVEGGDRPDPGEPDGQQHLLDQQIEGGRERGPDPRHHRAVARRLQAPVLGRRPWRRTPGRPPTSSTATSPGSPEGPGWACTSPASSSSPTGRWRTGTTALCPVRASR